MGFVRETVEMPVSAYYKGLQELQDRAQDIIDGLEHDKDEWREHYVELIKLKWEMEEERDGWRKLAFEHAARVYELEAELEQLKKGMGA